jgi:hypothetical protein
MTRLPLIGLAAFVALTGVAQAQSVTRYDPYGRPYVGSGDWSPGPGDYAREAPGPQPADNYYAPRQQAMAPMDRPAHSAAFTDEYGFRYDSRGNRIDRFGHVMSPHDPNAAR